MNKFQLIQHLLHYIFASKTKFDVHSPFVFSFITEILEDNAQYDKYNAIKQLSNTVKKNTSLIKKNDLGAGSKIVNNNTPSVAELFRSTSLHLKYAKLLFRICNYFKPQYIVELGTGFGTSAISMAMARHQPNVFTLEGNSDIAEVSKSLFNRMNLNNIIIKTGNFDLLLPELLNEIKQIDLAFIDGNHQKEKTIEYYKMIAEKCNNNSIIILDDIRWSTGMFEAWNEIIVDKRITLSFDLFRIGIAFFRKEQKAKEHFFLKF